MLFRKINNFTKFYLRIIKKTRKNSIIIKNQTITDEIDRYPNYKRLANVQHNKIITPSKTLDFKFE